MLSEEQITLEEARKEMGYKDNVGVTKDEEGNDITDEQVKEVEKRVIAQARDKINKDKELQQQRLRTEDEANMRAILEKFKSEASDEDLRNLKEIKDSTDKLFTEKDKFVDNFQDMQKKVDTMPVKFKKDFGDLLEKVIKRNCKECINKDGQVNPEEVNKMISISNIPNGLKLELENIFQKLGEINDDPKPVDTRAGGSKGLSLRIGGKTAFRMELKPFTKNDFKALALLLVLGVITTLIAYYAGQPSETIEQKIYYDCNNCCSQIFINKSAIVPSSYYITANSCISTQCYSDGCKMPDGTKCEVGDYTCAAYNQMGGFNGMMNLDPPKNYTVLIVVLCIVIPLLSYFLYMYFRSRK